MPVRAREVVIYWMQQSQREEDNHALEYAAALANSLDKPLIVFFFLTDRFPEANLRHYAFMLEGLTETAQALQRRGIGFIVGIAEPDQGIVKASRRACAVVTDRGYLRLQREWRASAARRIDCRLIEVETDVVVPVETASAKAEYSAGTFRARIQRHVAGFLKAAPRVILRRTLLRPARGVGGTRGIVGLLGELPVDRSVLPVPGTRGGTAAARKVLERFVIDGLDRYGASRNDPGHGSSSGLGPYLHFGQISPRWIARRVMASRSPGAPAFLEQLIVRRELSANFVHYERDYDSIACLPQWAQRTIQRHARDRRPYRYTDEELEQGLTHDPYWNAAQKEMVLTGRMHGYMRMYWGKKILEWSGRPERGYETALRLNNKYELDGRDPNAFAGVAWCFGKHDRPWAERPIYGMVRYMNAAGLERKFDMAAYLDRVRALEAERR